MSELKIDNEFINEVSIDIDNIVKTLNCNQRDMKNEKEDIFSRYISFMRLSSVIHCIKASMNAIDTAFRLGHDFHHEVFNTDEYKNSDWDQIIIEKNTFFVQDKEHREELFKKVLKLIAEKIGEEE